VREFADGFIGIIMKYTPFDGSLAEQYTRDEGTPISAKDLTWSYAAILTMFTARKGIVPPSWGAKELLLELPHVCQMGDQRDNGAVWVTFKVTAETAPGGMRAKLMMSDSELMIALQRNSISPAQCPNFKAGRLTTRWASVLIITPNGRVRIPTQSLETN